MPRHPRILAAFVVLSAGVAAAAYLGKGPDYELEMTREVPSESAPEKLAGFVADPALWTHWFHMTTEVRSTGDGTVLLTIDPKKGEWKKFELELKVLENAARADGGRKLRIEFVADSKRRVRKMFEDLRWDVDVLPIQAGARPNGRGGERALVRGTVRARTASFRARLFGRLSPRILLNQSLYPDLIGLAEIVREKGEPVLRMTP
jgi:hypothetical protein